MTNLQNLEQEAREKLKSWFEANFLDGDKLNDCGSCTFTAEGCFDAVAQAYELGKAEGREELETQLKLYGYGSELEEFNATQARNKVAAEQFIRNLA